MRSIRANFIRTGRVLLVSGLILSVPARSAVGEALVLHQHGNRAAHLHVLGFGELLSNSAFEATFGHSRHQETDWTKRERLMAHRNVRVLGIIPTGLVAVSTPRDSESKNASIILQCYTFDPFLDDEWRAAMRLPRLVIQQGRSASAVLLLRNHILLI